MSETGTTNIAEVVEFKTLPADVAEWLISFGWDDEFEIFIWHERRYMSKEQHDKLSSDLIAKNIRFEMLNITGLEHRKPLTIEDYIAAVR